MYSPLDIGYNKTVYAHVFGTHLLDEILPPGENKLSTVKIFYAHVFGTHLLDEILPPGENKLSTVNIFYAHVFATHLLDEILDVKIRLYIFLRLRGAIFSKKKKN